MAVSKGRLSLIGEKNIEGAPELLLEILSEGTEKRDRREKFSLYALSGVSESWIVDPESPIVQVFRLSGTKDPSSPLEFSRNDSLSTPSLPRPLDPPSPRFLPSDFFLKRAEPAMAGPVNCDRQSGRRGSLFPKRASRNQEGSAPPEKIPLVPTPRFFLNSPKRSHRISRSYPNPARIRKVPGNELGGLPLRNTDRIRAGP